MISVHVKSAEPMWDIKPNYITPCVHVSDMPLQPEGITEDPGQESGLVPYFCHEVGVESDLPCVILAPFG